MKLYITPGNSISNRDWALGVKKHLADLFNNAELLEYDHWASKKEMIDFDLEANKLKTKTGNESFAVFAKSAGVVLVLKAIKEKKLNPKMLILLGIPVFWCRENKIKLDEYLEGFHCPTLIIQNDHDPAIGAEELRKYLSKKGLKNYDFVEYKNNTHMYNNLDEIHDEIKRFIERKS